MSNSSRPPNAPNPAELAQSTPPSAPAETLSAEQLAANKIESIQHAAQLASLLAQPPATIRAFPDAIPEGIELFSKESALKILFDLAKTFKNGKNKSTKIDLSQAQISRITTGAEGQLIKLEVLAVQPNGTYYELEFNLKGRYDVLEKRDKKGGLRYKIDSAESCFSINEYLDPNDETNMYSRKYEKRNGQWVSLDEGRPESQYEAGRN